MISGLAEHARQRKAAGDRLRDGDQVGLDAVVLDREQLAGAAEAGLHLVGDEARSRARRRSRAALPRNAAGAGDEAALALHGLDDDRRDLLGGDLREERAGASSAERVSASGPR